MPHGFAGINQNSNRAHARHRKVTGLDAIEAHRFARGTQMKTIKLETLKRQANATFRDSVNSYKAERSAIHYFVADVLMKSNAYKGFRYLEAADVAPGQTIGLIRNPDNAAGPHTFPDESRIAFL
jgi:hypothetical protein